MGVHEVIKIEVAKRMEYLKTITMTPFPEFEDTPNLLKTRNLK